MGERNEPARRKGSSVVARLLRAVLCLLGSLAAQRSEGGRVGKNTLAFWLRSRLDQIQNPTLSEAAQVESTDWSHTAGLILALPVISCITLGKLFNLSLSFLMSQMGMALTA